MALMSSFIDFMVIQSYEVSHTWVHPNVTYSVFITIHITNTYSITVCHDSVMYDTCPGSGLILSGGKAAALFGTFL